MVADPGDSEDAATEGNAGDDVGDVSWSKLHEVHVAANLDEDHLTGDCVPEVEVVEDNEGNAFRIPRCLP